MSRVPLAECVCPDPSIHRELAALGGARDIDPRLCVVSTTVGELNDLDALREEVQTLRAEVERLRAALEKVVRNADRPGDMFSVAAAALEEVES